MNPGINARGHAAVAPQPPTFSNGSGLSRTAPRHSHRSASQPRPGPQGSTHGEWLHRERSFTLCIPSRVLTTQRCARRPRTAALPLCVVSRPRPCELDDAARSRSLVPARPNARHASPVTVRAKGERHERWRLGARTARDRAQHQHSSRASNHRFTPAQHKRPL